MIHINYRTYLRVISFLPNLYMEAFVREHTLSTSTRNTRSEGGCQKISPHASCVEAISETPVKYLDPKQE